VLITPTRKEYTMKIIPVQPRNDEQPAAGATRRSYGYRIPSRRTFPARFHPSRRTFIVRVHPSRRTMSFHAHPSRRTMSFHGHPSRRTFTYKVHPSHRPLG
jgi:hypothetical protein